MYPGLYAALYARRSADDAVNIDGIADVPEVADAAGIPDVMDAAAWLCYSWLYLTIL